MDLDSYKFTINLITVRSILLSENDNERPHTSTFPWENSAQTDTEEVFRLTSGLDTTKDEDMPLPLDEDDDDMTIDVFEILNNSSPNYSNDDAVLSEKSSLLFHEISDDQFIRLLNESSSYEESFHKRMKYEWQK